MRIKIDATRVFDISGIDIDLGTDHETVTGWLHIYGGAWKELFEDTAKFEGWDYSLIGTFCFGKYEEGDSLLANAEKQANAITELMLEDGYLDLTQYDNFALI